MSEGIFMNLDELCSTHGRDPNISYDVIIATKSAAMEKLVHELFIDRLLTLDRYITVDSSIITVLVDHTLLSADVYQLITQYVKHGI